MIEYDPNKHDESIQFALSAAGVGIWDIYLQEDKISIDAKCKELLGFAPGDANNRQTLYSKIHSHDQQRLVETFNRTLLLKADYTIDFQFRTAGPQQRWLRTKGRSFQDAQGIPVRFSGVLSDITAEMQAGEKIHTAESLAALALEGSDAGSFSIDLQTNELSFSPSLAYLLTGEANTNANRNIFIEHLHPEDVAVRDNAYKRAETTGLVNYEARFCWKDGSVHWIKVKGKYVQDLSGKPVAFSGIGQDITPEVNARKEQQKLLSLVEHSSDFIAVANLETAFTYMNEAGLDLLGLTGLAEARLKKIPDIFAPEYVPTLLQEVLPTILSNGKWQGLQWFRNFLTGELIPFQVDAFRLESPMNGRPIAFACVAKDLRQQMANRAALEKSEALFRTLVEQSPVAMSLLRGRDLVVETANKQILELWGKQETIIGKPLGVALPEIKGQGFIELLETVLETGEPHYGYETLARLERNGQVQDAWFNFVYAPLLEGGPGSRSGVMVVAVEVTAQVKAKFELQQSERRFKSLIQEAPMATALYVGKDLVIEIANEQMIRLWGKDKSVIGMRLAEALPELEGQPFLQILATQFTSGLAYHSTEAKVDLVVDGLLQTFYFNFTYKPLFNAAGEVFAILNMAVEITEQVLNRNQILETKRILESAVDIADLATWEIRPIEQGFIISDRMKTWMGYEAGEKVTLEQALATIPDRQKVEAAMAKAAEPGGKGILDVDYHLINSKTGRLYVMHSKGRTFFNEKGEAYLIVGTTQDITMQRQIEIALEAEVSDRTEELAASNEELTASNEELAALNEEFSVMNEELQEANENLMRSNQELEQYAYVASHDLQEPLRKIRIYSDMLGQQEMAENHQKLVGKIDQSAQRMSMLIKDLLEFSRLLETGAMIEPVDLNIVVQNVANDFELVIEDKKAKLILGELPKIEAISLQMNQLFYNLVGNALKFVQPNVPPVIRVSARIITAADLAAAPGSVTRSKLYYEISVEDNGIGFEQKYAEQVFQVFKRLHVSAVYPGSGIGLAMCKRIVMNHGGDLKVTSEPNNGTTFRIILPALTL